MLMAMPMTATVVATATEQLTELVPAPLGQMVLLRAPWGAWWQAHWQCIWQCYPDGSVWWSWLDDGHDDDDGDADDHNDGGDGNGKADGAGDKLAIMPLIA
jgi:hypothetical protein